MNVEQIEKIMTSAQTVYALLLIVFLLMYIAFYKKPSKKHGR